MTAFSDTGLTARLERIQRRFCYDPDDDLQQLWTCYQRGRFAILETGLTPHFAVAKARPAVFQDHDPVLAISVGGSNHKCLLASRRGGTVQVSHCRAGKNPAQPRPWQDWLQDLLFAHPDTAAYLRHSECPVIGVALPVALIDGVPFHPSKVPTITDFICRDMAQCQKQAAFHNRLQTWLQQNGVQRARILVASDGVLAHHGALSLSDAASTEATQLLVCGTGLATSDERAFVVTGQAPILADDELWPPAQTDRCQYQFTIAGKGVYGGFGRAVAWAKGQGLGLDSFDSTAWLSNPHDSKLVFDLWASTLPEAGPQAGLAELQKTCSAVDLALLQSLAAAMIPRGIDCLAHSVLVTLLRQGGEGVRLFLEGSIARDPLIIPRIQQRLQAIRANVTWFKAIGQSVPTMPRIDLQPSCEPVMAVGCDRWDYSAIGTATICMAASAIQRQS